MITYNLVCELSSTSTDSSVNHQLLSLILGSLTRFSSWTAPEPLTTCASVEVCW